MRPRLDRLTRQILPLLVFGTPICFAGDQPVLNELNTVVEEPLMNLPEDDSHSPFRSASRPRNVTSSGQQDQLTQLVQDAVDSTRRRLLATDINSPWQIMHGLLALRREFEVRHQGEIRSGLDWVSSGPSYEGEAWFEKTPYGGRAHPYSRPWAFEGHANQFLAILSMSALPLEHEFQTTDGPITIADMIEHAQKTINSKDEPTWTLWALSRYLPPDAAWRNTRGEPWSIERLVAIQTAKPLKGTACGGTHGMFALAHARNVYLRSGKPLRGVWLEAEYKIRRQINTARVQQNSNGMLSSNYFRGREYKRDFNKRMASAGHLLEFLMISLPQDELQQRWVQRAIRATAQDLLNNRKAEVRCSPLYHAVNALNIYLDRVQPQAPAQIADGGDTDSQLKPVDENTSTALKRVPATRISETKTVMKPDAEPADSAAENTEAAKTETEKTETVVSEPADEPAKDSVAASDELPEEGDGSAEANEAKTTASAPVAAGTGAGPSLAPLIMPAQPSRGSEQTPATGDTKAEAPTKTTPSADSDTPSVNADDSSDSGQPDDATPAEDETVADDASESSESAEESTPVEESDDADDTESADTESDATQPAESADNADDSDDE